MKLKFIILGEPKAKARPRFGKGGAVYTPDGTINYENWVKQCFILEHRQKFLEGQIRATIHAYFTIPKSATKGERLAMQHNITRPTKRPDTDNIAKIVLDSLNGLAYKDDSAVVDLVVKKFWSEEPRVEVILEEIEIKDFKE